jgi:O-antigen/teichoic acid export membrane protein
MTQSDSVVVLPGEETDLHPADPPQRQRSLQAVVLSGSIVMLMNTTIVSTINFVYNVVMARMLGPSRFGHVTASVTLLMLSSAVTLAFQMVCAKFVARNATPGAKVGVYRSLLSRAWVVSLALSGALFLARKPMAAFLNLPDARILGLLALGVAAYVPLGVRRGAMQGLCSFRRLSTSFITEAVTRLGAAVLLVAIGYGELGAVGAIGLAVLASYSVSGLGPELRVRSESWHPASFGEGIQAIVFFVGQVIICNTDVLVVKHSFAPDVAGLYAAVALVGRLLYFSSWSVVSVMFPVSAAVHSSNKKEDPKVVLLPLFVVLGLSAIFILMLSFFPHFVIHTIFGREFHQGEPLLALYAVATGLYSLSVVIMAYEMSRRIANTGWLQLIFSGGLVMAIGAFHSTLREVIVVQIVLMAALLTLVSFPFMRRHRQALATEAA